MSKVTVQVTGRGQHTVTIPRRLAEAMGIEKGQEIEWVVAGKDKLEMRL